MSRHRSPNFYPSLFYWSEVAYPVRIQWPEDEDIAPRGTVLKRWLIESWNYEARVLSSLLVPYVERSAPRLRRLYSVGLFIDGVLVEARKRTMTQEQVQKALKEMEKS